MADVVALVPVDWFVERDDMLEYRHCDLCHQAAYEEFIGSNLDWSAREFRGYWQQVGGVDDGLVVCEKCMGEYLAEKPA